MKKIIVLGATYASLTAAALIARKGYSVTVFDKKKEDELDDFRVESFDPDMLAITGLGLPESDKWLSCADTAIYPPSLSAEVLRCFDDNKRYIKMKSSDLFSHILSFAKENGVEFRFETKVNSLLFFGDRVSGIRTENEDFYAHLIIDSFGISSQARRALPVSSPVQKNIKSEDMSFNYFARFDNPEPFSVREKSRTVIFPSGETVIARIEAENEFTDVHITAFEPLTKNQFLDFTEYLREFNPSIGYEILYGGKTVKRPSCAPMTCPVCDGYAAIGSAAFMADPVTGECVTESLKAAKLLAKCVGKDRYDAFNRETLWPYQADYFKVAGSQKAFMYIIKNILLSLENDEIDLLFTSEVVSSEILSADPSLLFRSTDFGSIIEKIKKFSEEPFLFKKCAAGLGKLASIKGACAALPEKNIPYAVSVWEKAYEKIIK